MKHAFLIIAHNEPEVLATLLDMLDDVRNDIYLYIDRKAEALRARFATYRTRRAGFTLLRSAFGVYWGDISQVKAEYLLFLTAYRRGPYAYYHLLSGVDLPIQTQDDIHAFFRAHAGSEFVEIWQDAGHRRDLRRKVGRYYLFTRHLKDKGTWRHRAAALARNVTLAVQRIPGFTRPQSFEFQKGSNWVSVTHACCGYLLRARRQVCARLAMTLCPDEIFVQTLVWNSPFRDRLYRPRSGGHAALRHIDWERGSHGGPHVWTDADADELLASPDLFARKFTMRHPGVVRRLRAAYGPPAPQPV